MRKKIYEDVLDDLGKIELDVREKDAEESVPFTDEPIDADWPVIIQIKSGIRTFVPEQRQTEMISEIASFISETFSSVAEISRVRVTDAFSDFMSIDASRPSVMFEFGLKPRPGLSFAGAIRILRRLDSVGMMTAALCGAVFSDGYDDKRSTGCMTSNRRTFIMDYNNCGENIMNLVRVAADGPSGAGANRQFRQFMKFRHMCFRLCGYNLSADARDYDRLIKMMTVAASAEAGRMERRNRTGK
jgi:hypothetical protein